MTTYEINYKNRLENMLATITAKFGEQHFITEFFATLVNKYIGFACYDNREIMERYFAKYMAL